MAHQHKKVVLGRKGFKEERRWEECDRKFMMNFKVNGNTYRGSNCCIFNFASLLIRDNLDEHSLFILHFGRVMLSREATRRSQKLFPCVKLMENNIEVYQYI